MGIDIIILTPSPPNSKCIIINIKTSSLYMLKKFGIFNLTESSQ